MLVLATAANLLHTVSHTGQDVLSLEAWQWAYVVGVIFIFSFPDPDPGVGPGHRDAGAARRAEAMLPPGRGAYVPRCRARALDEPQGGVPLCHQGVCRSVGKGKGHDVHGMV